MSISQFFDPFVPEYHNSGIPFIPYKPPKWGAPGNVIGTGITVRDVSRGTGITFPDLDDGVFG